MIDLQLAWLRQGAASELRAGIVVSLVFGATVIAILTLAPPPIRGPVVVLSALAALVLCRKRPGAIMCAFLLTLILSEDTSNRLVEVFEREKFGSVWAVSIVGRVTGSDALAFLTVAIALLTFRNRVMRRVSMLDMINAGLGLLLLYAAARGLFGRLEIEDWRFWFFDVRAAIYMVGGYVIARTLLLTARRHEIVGLVIFSFAPVFALTVIQFVFSPTGYTTLYGTPILLTSETAILVAAFVLLAGAWVSGASMPTVLSWAFASAFMMVVDFTSGRRSGMLLIGAAIVALMAVTGQHAIRLGAALSGATMLVVAAAAVLAPAEVNAGARTVLLTIEALPGAAASQTLATPTPPSATPTPPSATPTPPSATPTPSPSASVAGGEPQIDATASGVETRAGEVANVLASVQARSGTWFGLGFGRVWQLIYSQPDDFFAVGPRSGLYGTPYRFNIHVPGLDYLLRFGVVGSALWALWAILSFIAILRWGRGRTLALAALIAALLMLSLWGNPRTALIEGLALGLVRVLEPQGRALGEAMKTLSRRLGTTPSSP